MTVQGLAEEPCNWSYFAVEIGRIGVRMNDFCVNRVASAKACVLRDDKGFLEEGQEEKRRGGLI